MTRICFRWRCSALPALVLAIACSSTTPRSAYRERSDGSMTTPPAARDSSVGQPSSATAEHCAQHEPPAATAPLPGQSLYHLQAALVDQRGARFDLAELRGQPVLIAMFYSSCTSICPLLIAQLQRIESTLAPEVRAQTRVLLVSLDPERDSVDRLAALARQHAITSERWHFTRTSDASVREIAALLGVRYRRTADGEINHSPLVALLDREGLLAVRVEGALADVNEIGSSLARMVPPSRPAPAAPRP